MRSALYKSMLIAFSLLYATDSFAKCCNEEARDAIISCKAREASANGGNDAAGKSAMGSPAASAPGGTDCGTGNQQNQTAGNGAGPLNTAAQGCGQDLAKCEKACQQAMSDKTCMTIPQQNRQSCESEIGKTIAGLQSAAQNLASSAAGGAASAGQGCGKGGQPPQLPSGSPSQGGGGDQAATTPTSATPASTNPGSTSPSLQNLIDGGKGADWGQMVKSLNGTPGSSTITQLPSTLGSTPAAPFAPTGGGSTGSTGSGSFTGKNETNRDDAKAREDALKKMMAEGKGDGRAPANEYGNEGGGGGGATGMNDASVDLSQFLPGGAKDPTKNKDKKMAAASVGPAHPDIAGKDTDLFSGVTKRMRLICDMKELIGCN